MSKIYYKSDYIQGIVAYEPRVEISTGKTGILQVTSKTIHKKYTQVKNTLADKVQRNREGGNLTRKDTEELLTRFKKPS